MPATAEVLRDLHLLHQRAKALRDRLPRPQDARRPSDRPGQPPGRLEKARKALQDAKVHAQEERALAPGLQTKIDDLKVKLNQVKKNEEYKAIQNQIAHDKSSLSKIEDEILQGYDAVETQDRRPWPSSRPSQDVRPGGRLDAEADRVPGRRRTRPAQGARDRHHRRRDRRSPKTNANATAGPSASSGPTPWPRR